MKPYDEYEMRDIGVSDVAALTLVGFNGKEVESHVLKFEGDGSYRAYIVDENAEIGTHYTKEAAFESWMRVYDDLGLTWEGYAQRINVFRAGDYGCIIQHIGAK